MTVEIRLYKQYDSDLISIYDAGYPVFDLMTQAVTAYAHGTPLHYLVDIPVRFPEDSRTVRGHLRIPNSDTGTMRLFKGIQPRFRNAFCKMALRNILVQQQLSCFFADRSLDLLQQQNINSIPITAYPSLIRLSTIPKAEKQYDLTGYESVAGVVKPKAKNTRVKSARTVSMPTPVQAAVSPVQQNLQANPQTPVQGITQEMLQSMMAQMLQQMQAQAGLASVQQAPVQSVQEQQEQTPQESAQTAEAVHIDAPDPGIQKADDADVMAMFDAL